MEVKKHNFASGGQRSERKAPWWMMPFEILDGMCGRYDVGRKYGINNWKAAAATRDLEFIRDIVSHDMGHLKQFLNFYSDPLRKASFDAAMRIDDPKTRRALIHSIADEEGESRLQHAFAHIWNAIALAWYEYWHPDIVEECFYQDWRGERREENDAPAKPLPKRRKR